MKCTNIYDINAVLHELAKREIRKAIDICGGEYVWTGDSPMVVAHEEYVFEVNIKRIFKDSEVRIEGVDLDSGEAVQVYLDDLSAIDILLIVECMGRHKDNAATQDVQKIVDKFTNELEDAINGR